MICEGLTPRFTLWLAAVFATLAPSMVDAAPERTHDIVAEDYFSLSWIIDVAASPDGGPNCPASARTGASTANASQNCPQRS